MPARIPRITVACIALGIIAITSSCSPNENATADISVRLKWLHQAQFAGFYVADKAGYYRQAGLNVKLNPGGVDFPAIQMVASGSEQFGVTGADQLILAREKGVPVVALAVIYRITPMVLFSLKSKNITEPRHLLGKRVGVKLGGNEELTYRALVRRLNLDPSKITEVPVKYDMSPLFTGAVDVWPGYVINEPIAAEEKGFPVNSISPAKYGVNLYADTLFTTENFIRQNRTLVQRFVAATLQGWERAANDISAGVSATLAYDQRLSLQHETAMMKASIPLLRPDSRPIGSMDPKVWAEMQVMLLENNFLQKPITIESVYSTDFLPSK